MTTTMSKSQFLTDFADLMGQPEGSIGYDTKLVDVEGWDSVNIMSFILFVDHHFEFTIDPDEIEQCQSIHDLAQLLGDRLE